MFNKKQLILLWVFIGILCSILLRASIASGPELRLIFAGTHPVKHWMVYRGASIVVAVNWLRLSLIPIILFGVAFLTFQRH